MHPFFTYITLIPFSTCVEFVFWPFLAFVALITSSSMEPLAYSRPEIIAEAKYDPVANLVPFLPDLDPIRPHQKLNYRPSEQNPPKTVIKIDDGLKAEKQEPPAWFIPDTISEECQFSSNRAFYDLSGISNMNKSDPS